MPCSPHDTMVSADSNCGVTFRLDMVGVGGTVHQIPPPLAALMTYPCDLFSRIYEITTKE